MVSTESQQVPDSTSALKRSAENQGDESASSSGAMRAMRAKKSKMSSNHITWENGGAAKKLIQEKYLLDMPQDFFRFWEFCSTLNPDNPEAALQATLGLRLVGPYDLISGNADPEESTDEFLCHWRYYFDPPEMQTVLGSVYENGDPNDNDGFHVGYFRDDPKENPVFVCSNGAKRSHKLNILGENLFGAVYNHISGLMNKADPFKQSAYQKLKESIYNFATMKFDFPLEPKTQNMKIRDKKKLAPCFHGAGLVVPYNKDTMVGYREIPEGNPELKKIFQNILDSSDDDRDEKFDVLQELVTNVQFANDEGDPGMGLELGLALLSHGGDLFHATIDHLLSVAYSLLQREEFGRIIKSHLTKRTKGVLLYKISKDQD